MIDLARATMSSLPQQLAADPPTPSNNPASEVPAVARRPAVLHHEDVVFLVRSSFRNVYVEEEFMPTMFTSRASLTSCNRFLISSATRFLTYLLMPTASLIYCAELSPFSRRSIRTGTVAGCGEGVLFRLSLAAWIRNAGLIVPLMAIPFTY